MLSFVQEIKEMRAKREELGASSKEGQRLKKQEGARRERMYRTLEEIYVWKIRGTSRTMDEVRISEAEVKQMLETGEPPWQSFDHLAAKLYWGKLFHRNASDLARCKKEMVDLPIQKQRLVAWLQARVSKILSHQSFEAEAND